jgi:hypothetical protein
MRRVPRQMRLLVDHGTYPAFADARRGAAGGDQELRRGGGSRARQVRISRCCYGIRRDSAGSFIADGYGCGSTCPSVASGSRNFMRRLGERPANVWFVIRAILREKR